VTRGLGLGLELGLGLALGTPGSGVPGAGVLVTGWCARGAWRTVTADVGFTST
jgi:hypothetical protein